MPATDGFVITPNPTAHFGVGAIEKLPDMVRASGADHVVVVTDAALADTPVIAEVTAILADACLPAHVFSGVHPNPTTDDLAAGAEAVAEVAAGATAGPGGRRGRHRVRHPQGLSAHRRRQARRGRDRAGRGGRRVAHRRGQGDRAGRGQPAARPGPGLPRRLRRPGPAHRGRADHGGDRCGDQRVRRGDRSGRAPQVLRGPRQLDAGRRDPRSGPDRGPAPGGDRRDRHGRADPRAGVLPVAAPQSVVGRDRAAGDPDDRREPAAGRPGRHGLVARSQLLLAAHLAGVAMASTGLGVCHTIGHWLGGR